MNKGIIFDIKEFAINDGPGIRITIFMKGCPLHCIWCHNPEGILVKPQLNNKNHCVKGKEYSVREVVDKILTFQDVFEMSNGGVTFSGGEPTLQAEFIYTVASKLQTVHKTLDTSGFCKPEMFSKLLTVFDLVYFDLKLINEEEHIKYTGVSNKLILENLKILDKSRVPYHIRVPLIPEITDTSNNLNEIQNIILGLENKPLRVDPLPYNILAGGKYEAYDMEFKLKDLKKGNNIQNIERFKQNLRLHNIKVMGDEVKCLQND